MSGETTITLVGNLTADPELRFLTSGVPCAAFTVASTPRTFDKQTNEWRDGDPLFLHCTVWRQQAENVANTLQKGTRVILTGRLTQRTYQARDGSDRTVVEVQVDEIGPSLRSATAVVTRVGAHTITPPQQSRTQNAGADPWATASNRMPSTEGAPF